MSNFLDALIDHKLLKNDGACSMT